MKKGREEERDFSYLLGVTYALRNCVKISQRHCSLSFNSLLID